jgi:NTE family protein
MLRKSKLGIALSGGGIKGLAHLGVLKTLDTHQIKPNKLAGTSMGAIIAALYASGLSAQDIEQRIKEHLIYKQDPLKEIYKKRDKLFKWLKFFSLEKTRGGIIAVDGLFKHLFEEISELEFSDLDIPLAIVATDFYSGEEYVFENGNVVDALKASIAVPGIFAPQKHDGRTLVDGGLVNNLPSKQIQDCELRIGSDVICYPEQKQTLRTSKLLNGSLNIMLKNMTKLTLERYPCDLVLNPDVFDIGAFDIGKIDQAISLGHVEAEKRHDEIAKILTQFAPFK